MKLTDKAILRMVSESPGRNTSEPRRVQKYKRTLRPTRRAVAEFIYHYHGELNHQGLGNAFVFLDTTGLPMRTKPLTRLWLPHTVGRRTSPTTRSSASYWR